MNLTRSIVLKQNGEGNSRWVNRIAGAVYKVSQFFRVRERTAATSNGCRATTQTCETTKSVKRETSWKLSTTTNGQCLNVDSNRKPCFCRPPTPAITELITCFLTNLSSFSNLILSGSSHSSSSLSSSFSSDHSSITYVC